MFDYFAKNEVEKQKKFQSNRDKFLMPIVKTVTKFGITANHITYLSITLFFIALYFIIQKPILGFIIGFFYCLLDGLDGPLSRYQNTASKAGSLLDMFADQIGVIVLPVASIIYFGSNEIFAYLFGLFYIVDIFLITILNTLNHRVNFIIRVKYFYYGLFALSAYLHLDLLTYFYYVFGIFYTLHSLYLYRELMKEYKRV